MVSLIVIWALVGVGLGTYFPAFILIPASTLCLMIVGGAGLIESVDIWGLVVMMIIGVTTLHLGYLAGSFVHVVVTDHDRPDEKQTHMPHKLLLGSDRSQGR